MHTRRDLLQGTLAAACLGPGQEAEGAEQPVPVPVSAVERRRIPRTGELLPCMGLGTSRTFDVDPAGGVEAQLRVMGLFLATGGSLVDSSPMYGRAESVVGRVLGDLRRRDVFLATKVWTDKGREAGIHQMETSAERMGTGRFDLLQVHNLVDYRTHVRTLREWKAAGRVRYIGATQMRDLAEVERIVREDALDFIQVPYSMVEREVEARVLPAARDHGVAVLVMRPFQRAGLFDRVAGKPLPSWAAELRCTSWAQVFLKWVLGHPAVTCPIPATANPAHLLENMGAGSAPYPDEGLRKRMLADVGV